MTEPKSPGKIKREKNLEKGKATQFKTGEQQAKIASKGGKASQAKRREQMSVAERFKVYLRLTQGKGDATDVGNFKEIADIETANLTIEDQMVIKCVEMARKGNLKALEMVWKMTGQMPKEQSEITITEKPAEDMSIEELAAAIAKEKSKKAKE